MNDDSGKTFEAVQKVNAIKEHFIDRYLTATGARIEDCELCEQMMDGVIRMWIRRKSDAPATAEIAEVLPPTDAYIHKLKPGEPHFLLMARDPYAPVLLRSWADMEELFNGGPTEKSKAARITADAMEVWRAAQTTEIAE